MRSNTLAFQSVRTHRSGPRGRSLFGRLVLLLAVASALARCGRSSIDSSVAGSVSAQPSGTEMSPTAADGNGNGTPATTVSGDFTIQTGSYYDRTAGSLAGDAEHYNLHVRVTACISREAPRNSRRAMPRRFGCAATVLTTPI